MPTITNPGVIEKLINSYMLNGMDKVGALVETGYSKTYANNGKGARLFERADVKAEIKRQQLELIKKTGFTKEQAHAQIMEDREFARKKGQPGAAATSTNQLIRLYGMDQMGSVEAVQIVINPPKSPKMVESGIIENEM